MSTIKIRYWVPAGDVHKEAIIDVKKLVNTVEEWVLLDDEQQDFLVACIPNIRKDWGYSIVRG